jgi:hypothetical protein
MWSTALCTLGVTKPMSYCNCLTFRQQQQQQQQQQPHQSVLLNPLHLKSPCVHLIT